MFAAGKRFIQQRCASHGGAVLHSISVHADRAIGGNRHYRHSGGDAAARTFRSTGTGKIIQLHSQLETVRIVDLDVCRQQ